MSSLASPSWLRRFVEAVRPSGPRVPGLSSLDHSLAAAFVAVAQPSTATNGPPRSPDIAGDPVFGPLPVNPVHRANPPRTAFPLARESSRSATRAHVEGRDGPAATAAARPRGPGIDSAWPPRPFPSELTGAPTGGRMNGLPWPVSGARGSSQPGTADGGVPVATAPVFGDSEAGSGERTHGIHGAARAISPAALAVLEARLSTLAQSANSADRGTADGAPAATDPAPVVPLVELLRDLAPVSPLEARLESVWQQRQSAAGFDGFNDPWRRGPETVATDWGELARRLDDLEAGAAG